VVEDKKELLLDLRGIPCPQNVSRLLIYMTRLKSGTPLDVLLDGGEPFDNVMESLMVEEIKVVDVLLVSDFKKKIRLIVK